MGKVGNHINVLCVLALSLGTIMTTDVWNDTEQDIPVRCINNTVTKVTCDDIDDDSDKLVPHPDDCQLFYYCVAANLPPICRQCPAGLHFNPQKHVCDLPERAGCASGNDADGSASR